MSEMSPQARCPAQGTRGLCLNSQRQTGVTQSSGSVWCCSGQIISPTAAPNILKGSVEEWALKVKNTGGSNLNIFQYYQPNSRNTNVCCCGGLRPQAISPGWPKIAPAHTGSIVESWLLRASIYEVAGGQHCIRCKGGHGRSDTVPAVGSAWKLMRRERKSQRHLQVGLGQLTWQVVTLWWWRTLKRRQRERELLDLGSTNQAGRRTIYSMSGPGPGETGGSSVSKYELMLFLIFL